FYRAPCFMWRSESAICKSPYQSLVKLRFLFRILKHILYKFRGHLSKEIQQPFRLCLELFVPSTWLQRRGSRLAPREINRSCCAWDAMRKRNSIFRIWNACAYSSKRLTYLVDFGFLTIVPYRKGNLRLAFEW